MVVTTLGALLAFISRAEVTVDTFTRAVVKYRARVRLTSIDAALKAFRAYDVIKKGTFLAGGSLCEIHKESLRWGTASASVESSEVAVIDGWTQHKVAVGGCKTAEQG